MENLFRNSIEKNLLNNKTISTKDDILNNNKIKNAITTIIGDDVELI